MKEDLLLYVTEDNKMTKRLLPNHQYVTDNLIDLEQEELFIFEKDQILVKKKETLDLRIIPVIMNTLIDDLAQEKKFKEAYELLMRVHQKDKNEIFKLALNSLAALSPFSQKIVEETQDLQLMHLAEEQLLKS